MTPDFVEEFYNNRIRKDADSVCLELTRRMRKSSSVMTITVFFLHELKNGRREFKMPELRGIISSPNNLYVKLLFFKTYGLIRIERPVNPAKPSIVVLTDDFVVLREKLEVYLQVMFGEKKNE